VAETKVRHLAGRTIGVDAMPLNLEAFKDHPWIALIAIAVVVVVPALAVVFRARIAAGARVEVAQLQYKHKRPRQRRRRLQPQRQEPRRALDHRVPKLLEAGHGADEGGRREELARAPEEASLIVEVDVADPS
jgi:hypothetical protein